jgi:large subunit ribosomal protein L25
MKDESVMEVEIREDDTLGKGASKALRRRGVVPGVVYGLDLESVPICIERDTVLEILQSEGGINSIFKLVLKGGESERWAMIKDIQLDPVHQQLIHIDFVRLDMEKKIETKVPVNLEGVAEGVKNEGGHINWVTREIDVLSLPTNIPDRLTVDISALSIGDSVRVSVIEIMEGIEILTDPNTVIASVEAPRAIEEVAPEPEVEAEAEAEEEGAEPEVVKKGKEEEEKEKSDEKQAAEKKEK